MKEIRCFILFLLWLLAIDCTKRNNQHIENINNVPSNTGCKYIQNIENLNNVSSSSELILLAYQLRKDSLFYKICNILNDSIRSEENLFWFSSIIDINYEEKEVLFSFHKIGKLYPIIHVSNCMEVSIENDDTILVENNLGTIDDIKRIAKEYISNPNSNCNYFKKEVIDYFGEVELPIIGTQLIFKVRNKKGLTINEWKIFFDCMHELLSVYEEKRNEISMNKWNIKYDSLDIEKKIAVTKRVNYILFLFFYIEY